MTVDPMELPDFRNLGVMLRMLLAAECVKFVVLLAYLPDGPLLSDWWFAHWNPLYELILLCIVMMLFVLAAWLKRIPYQYGVRVVLGVAGVVAGGLYLAVGWLEGEASTLGALKASFMAAVLAGVILTYFNWRQRVLSPALAESRLMALQARIRPHFLFNSINAAISVVREDPKRAEEVLLDMSDLFRVVLAEPRALVPLANELHVARAYLDIEKVRLGDRLRVRWECDDAPADALVPVLLLQPLVENAVWHGIEPAPEGGEIVVRIGRRHKTLQIDVSNPVVDSARSRQGGNRIALGNLQERLALHFDAEGQLRVIEKQGEFRVRVRLPLTREGAQVRMRH
ncbi:MAG TPA: histidine kinase [Azoarcus taiwanensis]|nr:histidine kinase [Azoarcus taiwanensis]